MKLHTTEELKAMSIEEAEKYYVALHKAHASTYLGFLEV